jgi:Putative prokaryotic signal transducing protein
MEPVAGGLLWSIDMREVLASNDPVVLSYAEASLKAAGIGTMMADQYMAGMEGSIGIFPRRLHVAARDEERARTVLTEAGLGAHLADTQP